MELMINAELSNRGVTMLDNCFITDYLPCLSEQALKCYLYSVYLFNTHAYDPTMQLTSILGCDNDDLLLYYNELKEVGLVAIKSAEPLNIEILAINGDRTRVKKFDKGKYSDFIATINDMFKERVILPNEIMKYIETIEDCHITPEAMLMVAAHCLRTKGVKIHVNYILTVAKSWAKEGATTEEKVEQYLQALEANNENMRRIYHALGLKSMPDFDDKQLYLKWYTSWGYDIDCITLAAEHLRKKGGISRLDSYLDKLYRRGIYTLKDIEEYATFDKRATTLAKEVITRMGLYYQDRTAVVSTYITDWINLGFEDNATLAVATYCLTHSVRTLAGMNDMMARFYKDGLTTLNAINTYIDNAIATDILIKELFDLAGAPRTVKDADRRFYHVWNNDWGFGHDIISYAAQQAVGKMQPTTFMNILLAKWHQEHCYSLSECQASAPPLPTFNAKPEKSKKTKMHSARFDGERKYTKEELDSVFGSLSNLN